MNIEFNKVTWYSKLGAIILFLLFLPMLTFYIGMQYEKTSEIIKKENTMGQNVTSGVDDSLILSLASAYNGKVVEQISDSGDNFGKKEKVIEWYPKQADIDTFFQEKNQNTMNIGLSSKLVTKIISSVTTASGQKILLTSTSYCDAHVCPAILGGAVLSKDNDAYKINVLGKYIDVIGGFGYINTPLVMYAGKDNYIFKIENIGGGQGNFGGSLLMYSFIGGAFKNVLDIENAYFDNTSSFGEKINPIEYNTIPEFLTRSNQNGYYDLLLTTVGNRYENDDYIKQKVISADHVASYTFNGKEYVLKNQ